VGFSTFLKTPLVLPDADSRGPAGGHDVGDLRAALHAQLVRHRQELRHGQVGLIIKSGLRISIILMPDSTFYYNADSDPAFHFEADPDPHQSDKNLRSMVYKPFRALLEAFILSVHGSILSFNADPDPAAKFVDLDPHP
jgi:hypothetical protein